jgi:hypothetical protein
MYICSLRLPVPGIDPRSPTTSPEGELRQTSTVAHKSGDVSKLLGRGAPLAAAGLIAPLAVLAARRASVAMTLTVVWRTGSR